MTKQLTLTLLPKTYSVCRLDKKEEIPKWALCSEFFSITKTMDELSIVTSQENVPAGIKNQNNWKILKVEGPLDFSLVGILSKLSTILADNDISIFAVSTFDTDYILIGENNMAKGIEALREKGYIIS